MRKNTYQANFLSTVPASFAEAPPPLFERHPASFAEAPPTENTALARAAAASDLDVSSIRLIDRVFSSKISDFEPETLAYFRRWMGGHMAKFGVDEDGRPLTNPHPPTDEEVARFLRVDEPGRLARLLEDLLIERHPVQKYIWFVSVALQRCAGIDVRAQKTARAALKQVKRSAAPAAPAAEQSGLDFAGEISRQAVAGAKKLR